MREAFACVIDDDRDGMLAAIHELGEDGVAIAVDLARLVTQHATRDAEPYGMTDEDVTGYGQDIAAEVGWATLDGRTVTTYLRELVRDEPPTTDEGDTVMSAFVCGAYFVAGVAPQGRPWGEYLDDLLARVPAKGPLPR
jgi:hypothetical protein